MEEIYEKALVYDAAEEAERLKDRYSRESACLQAMTKETLFGEKGNEEAIDDTMAAILSYKLAIALDVIRVYPEAQTDYEKLLELTGMHEPAGKSLPNKNDKKTAG